ncbi:MAG TPA: hypothetical protein VFJ91_05880 [Gaiellaceae bacterium]|nr:hypothetical protein [Gaiellaceae bacterium]
MRRVLVPLTALLALALPAAATAHLLRGSGPNDGTLVVRNADNGDGVGKDARPVVTLVISGFVIGRVSGEGRIAIYDLDSTDQSSPEVTGAEWHRDATTQDGISGTSWGGTQFTFRAVQGTYKVVIYGSGVYLFAGGQGRVWFTGQDGAPDGSYSINGDDWRSLPFSGMRIVNANAG